MARTGIKEIARMAGVSPGTVSKVFNRGNRYDIAISESTRERVLNAARELHYIPSARAQTLASGRSRTVGVLVRDGNTEHFGRLIEALNHNFHDQGMTLHTEFHYDNADTERRALEILYADDVALLIIARTGPGNNTDLIGRFLDSSIQVINLGADDVPHPAADCVAYHEPRIMELIAGHLHRNALSPVLFLHYASVAQFSAVIRERHLLEALKAYPEISYAGAVAAADYPHCREVVRDLLRRPDAPRALVCFNDNLAASVIHAVQAEGGEVPRDFEVVGIDGFSNFFFPMELTTVRLPVEKMAAACCELYLEAQEERKRQPKILSPDLVIGTSSGKRIQPENKTGKD